MFELVGDAEGPLADDEFRLAGHGEVVGAARFEVGGLGFGDAGVVLYVAVVVEPDARGVGGEVGAWVSRVPCFGHELDVQLICGGDGYGGFGGADGGVGFWVEF